MVWGLEFVWFLGVWGLGFGVFPGFMVFVGFWGFGVWGLGFGVWGFWGLGCRALGFNYGTWRYVV